MHIISAFSWNTSSSILVRLQFNVMITLHACTIMYRVPTSRQLGSQEEVVTTQYQVRINWSQKWLYIPNAQTLYYNFTNIIMHGEYYCTEQDTLIYTLNIIIIYIYIYTVYIPHIWKIWCTWLLLCICFPTFVALACSMYVAARRYQF